ECCFHFARAKCPQLHPGSRRERESADQFSERDRQYMARHSVITCECSRSLGRAQGLFHRETPQNRAPHPCVPPSHESPVATACSRTCNTKTAGTRFVSVDRS